MSVRPWKFFSDPVHALKNRTSAAPPAAKKPPKMENVGSKWYIENFDGNEELQVTDPSSKTAVLFVKNTKSLLQVRPWFRINLMLQASARRKAVLFSTFTFKLHRAYNTSAHFMYCKLSGHCLPGSG